MTRTICALLSCGLCAALAGCSTDNPRICNADSECPEKIAAGHYADSDDGDGFVLAKDKRYCHPTKHYCYAGCTSSAQCQDSTLRMNLAQPDKTHCNMVTHHCAAPGAGGDGGPGDLGTDLENGAPCGAPESCLSGFCADGVCCATACEGTCASCALPGKQGSCEIVPAGEDPAGDCAGEQPACAGTCDGAGACAYPGGETSCGTATCTEHQIAALLCDGSGGCAAAAAKSCGGYACNDAGTACKTRCTDAAIDCEDSFACVGGQCAKPQDNGAACGTNPLACKSGYCVEGTCCAVSACPDCQTCSTADGTCQPRPAGAAPAGECPGDAACTAGQCDGAGACAYAALGSTCAESCATHTHYVSVCDAAHACVALAPESCSPFTCDTAGVACRTGCGTANDCVAASLCDRSDAHVTGAGTCVPTASILHVSSTIQAAIDSLAGQTYVKVPPGGYAEKLSIAGKAVRIVGQDGVTLAAPQFVEGPVVSVSSGADATLQGLTVQGATGADGDGIKCTGMGTGTSTSLRIVESTIKSNEEQAIESFQCNVAVRRSRVQGNQGGGLSLTQGKLTVINNVVIDNGSSGSSVGGVALQQAQIGSSFANNTVYKNRLVGGTGSGVACLPAVEILNSIVYGNEGADFLGCTARNSDIEGGASGTGNIDVDPQFVDLSNGNFSLQPTSQCIDKGVDNPYTAIDIAGSPRKKGLAVDIGAYEVQ